MEELDNLQNDKYVSRIQLELDKKKQDKLKLDNERQADKIRNREIKAQKQILEQEKINIKNEEKLEKDKEKLEEDDEFNSQIMGRTKRELYNSIGKYKELFKEELKNFKIKKNASAEELQSYISEMQVIIETTSIDSFLMDSLYTGLALIEPITQHTKINIRGLSDILKSNKQFNSLTKQMLLKYGCYSNVGIEYQVLLIIISSVYITVNKNNNRESINNYLNEKI